jgi:hypothetical protein
MKRFVSGLAAVGVVACLAPLGARAAAPSGPYEVTVGGAQQVSLPYGAIHTCVSGRDISVCFDVDYAANQVGDIGGGGSLTLGGIADGTLPVTASGKASGTTISPKTKVLLKFGGAIEALGMPGTGKGTIAFSCQTIGMYVGVQSCKGRVHLCGRVPGLGSECASAPISPDVLAYSGPWTLTLDLATDAMNAVTGSAEVTLSTAQTLDFEVAGKYNPKKDVSSLKFLGTGLAEKAQLSLKNFSPAANTGVLKFKLGGEKGSVDLSTLPH